MLDIGLADFFPLMQFFYWKKMFIKILSEIFLFFLSFTAPLFTFNICFFR